MPLTQEAPVPAGVLLQASGGCQVPPLPGKTQALLSLHCFPASNTAESVVLALFRQASQHLLGIYCEPGTFCALYMCLLIRPTQQRWRERERYHYPFYRCERGSWRIYRICPKSHHP